MDPPGYRPCIESTYKRHLTERKHNRLAYTEVTHQFGPLAALTAESQHLADFDQNFPKPRVGFFGLIDGRFDGNLVGELAERMPDISFVFAGPTDASAGELPHRENLHFVGAIPYAELPSFIAGMTTLILPYKVNGLAEMLSPLKLKEYLATRKPVVSAPIAAARDWLGSLLVARSPTDWESALRGIVNRKSVECTTEFTERLAAESWYGKANELLALCQCVNPPSSVSAIRDAVAAP